jgi:hypothetical protein
LVEKRFLRESKCYWTAFLQLVVIKETDDQCDQTKGGQRQRLKTVFVKLLCYFLAGVLSNTFVAFSVTYLPLDILYSNHAILSDSATFSFCNLFTCCCNVSTLLFKSSKAVDLSRSFVSRWGFGASRTKFAQGFGKLQNSQKNAKNFSHFFVIFVSREGVGWGKL